MRFPLKSHKGLAEGGLTADGDLCPTCMKNSFYKLYAAQLHSGGCKRDHHQESNIQTPKQVSYVCYGMESFRKRYEYVRVLSINWAPDEDDSVSEKSQLVRMKEQSSRLMKVFRSYYYVEVEEFQIPRSHAYRALSRKLTEVQETHNDQRLFLIIYYGGHGGLDQNRQARWKCFDRNDAKEVNWTALQATFLTDDSELDVLMILDCCKAAGASVYPRTSVTGNIVYVLAACGFDTNTPLYGDTTFTVNLTAELRDQCHTPPGLSDLPVEVGHFASLLMDRLRRIILPSGEKGVCPTHYVLRSNKRRALWIGRQPQLVTWDSWSKHSRTDGTVSSMTASGSPSNAPSRFTDESLNAEVIQEQSNGQRGDAAETPRLELYEASATSSEAAAVPSHLAFLRTWFEARSPGAQSSELRQINQLFHDLWFRGICRGPWCWPLQSGRRQNLERMLDHNVFRQWAVSNGKGAFWISGMSRELIEDATCMLVSNEQVKEWNHFIFLHSLEPFDGKRLGSCKLYRSLLWQLLKFRPDQASNVKKLIGNNKITSLDDTRLKSICSVVLGRTREDLPICIFMDLPDGDGGEGWLSHVLDQLEEISAMDRVKLCMASGFHPLISRTFADAPALLLVGDGLFDERITVGADLAILGRVGAELAGLRTTLPSDGVGQISYLNSYQNSYQQGGSRLQLQNNFYGSNINDHNMSDKAPDYPNAVCIPSILRTSAMEVVGPRDVTLRPVLAKVALHFALEQIDDPNIAINADMRAMESTELRNINQSITCLLRRLSGHTSECNDVGPAQEEDEVPPALVAAIERYLGETFPRFTFRDWRHAHANFDPSLVLLGSSILQLKRLPDDQPQMDDIQSLRWWTIVEQGLAYAQRVPVEQQKTLDTYVSELDRTVTSLLAKSPMDNAIGDNHWSSFLPLGRSEHPLDHDDLLSMAIEYAILPFVKARIQAYPEDIKKKAGRPLLHYAIFPTTGTTNSDWRTRLEIIRLLYKSGADPSAEFAQNTVKDSLEIAYMRANMQLGYVSSSTLHERHEFLGKVRSLFDDKVE